MCATAPFVITVTRSTAHRSPAHQWSDKYAMVANVEEMSTLRSSVRQYYDTIEVSQYSF